MLIPCNLLVRELSVCFFIWYFFLLNVAWMKRLLLTHTIVFQSNNNSIVHFQCKSPSFDIEKKDSFNVKYFNVNNFLFASMNRWTFWKSKMVKSKCYNYDIKTNFHFNSLNVMDSSWTETLCVALCQVFN